MSHFGSGSTGIATILQLGINSSPGAWSFTISFATDDFGESPTNWTVSGIADATVAPKLRVTRRIGGVPASIPDAATDTCGQVTQFVAQSFSYTIQNVGSAPLSVARPFSGSPTGMSTPPLTGTLPSPLAPGESTLWSIPVTATGTPWQITPVVTCNDTSVSGTYNWTMSGTSSTTGAEIGIQRNSVDILSLSNGNGSAATGGGGCGAGSAGAFLLIALCGVGLRRRR